MTSEISAISVAVCGTFLICLLLFTQRQKRPAKDRQWFSDGSGSDGASYLGDSGNHLSGIDGSHSGSHSQAHGHGGDHSGFGHSGDSGSSGDSGGSDGGGGGDGGGDGGGGGGD
jgi:hypothetical protein